MTASPTTITLTLPELGDILRHHLFSPRNPMAALVGSAADTWRKAAERAIEQHEERRAATARDEQRRVRK